MMISYSIKYSLGFATVLLIAFSILLYWGIHTDNFTYILSGFCCLVVAFLIAVITTIVNFIQVEEDHFSFDSIVLKRLRSLLVKINKEFMPKGLVF